MDTGYLVAALLLGLAGSSHCLGMCGGIVGALSLAGHKGAAPPFGRVLFYNFGRLSSYTLMGLIAATLVGAALPSSMPYARTVAALLLIAMAAYMAGWTQALSGLERLGQFAWRVIRPLANRFIPVDRLDKAFLVGLCWGWLPCGLVYTALSFAAAQDSPAAGALAMLAFGVGTLPTLLLAGLLGTELKTLLRHKWTRLGLALGYLLFGLWTLLAAWGHGVLHQSVDSAHPGDAPVHMHEADHHH